MDIILGPSTNYVHIIFCTAIFHFLELLQKNQYKSIILIQYIEFEEFCSKPLAQNINAERGLLIPIQKMITK